MVANLILEAAGTAGMLAAEVTKKPDASNQEKKRTMIQAAIRGPVTTLKLLNTVVGKAGMLGLNLSISSALRQGQTFTAMVSTLFQLAGMFFDMAFAPLVPGIARMLKGLANKLPGYADFIESVSVRVQQTFDQYKGKLSKEEWADKIASVILKLTGTYMESISGKIGDWFLSLPMWLQAPLAIPVVKLAGILGITGFTLKQASRLPIGSMLYDQFHIFKDIFYDYPKWVVNKVVKPGGNWISNSWIVDKARTISDQLEREIRQDPIFGKFIQLIEGAPKNPLTYLKIAVNAYNTVEEGIDSALSWLGVDKLIEDLVGYNRFLADTVEQLTSNQKFGNSIKFINN